MPNEKAIPEHAEHLINGEIQVGVRAYLPAFACADEQVQHDVTT
nr:hypothetical protein [Kineosporia babensis]